MNGFMNEVFAIFGMIFSFGLLVAGLMKTVRYFSELNEFKSDSIRSIKWIKRNAEISSDKIFKAEQEIEVLGKCNNTNRDSQRVLETDLARIFERQKEELEAIRKLSEKIGLCRIEIEENKHFQIKADKKIAEIENGVKHDLLKIVGEIGKFGQAKIDIEALRKYSIKQDEKIIELQERIDKLSAKAE